MKIKLLIAALAAALITGCGPGFQVIGGGNSPTPVDPVDHNVYFPIAAAQINVSSYGSLALNMHKPSFMDLIMPRAFADVAQGSATITVSYTNPGATAFTVNTAALGTAITTTGTDLNLGSVTLASLDDNTLRVCTGVGAPSNKCNRLYIRVFTLGTATGGITGTAGFINTADGYALPVYAGSVVTALGFNASSTAAAVTNAATVYTFTIPNGTNRVKLTDIVNNAIPIKADLSNAGSGPYQMNLVIQYALGYQ